MRSGGVLRWLVGGVAVAGLAVAAAVGWLAWDSGRPLDPYWAARHGHLAGSRVEPAPRPGGQIDLSVAAWSDSGFSVHFQVLRRDPGSAPSPVLLILGGQETGSRAVRLFVSSGPAVVAAIDYPYDGDRDFTGIAGFFRNLPEMRRACRDTPAAVSLVVDWLDSQDWVDHDRVVLAGVSFGVPFSAAAAANDDRIRGLILAHGAADNHAWAVATASRHLPRALAVPIGTLVNWLAYGPAYDTVANVHRVAPRPILVVGARRDERTPAGQAEILYAAAGANRLLRWTDGPHVQVNRTEVVDQLKGILEREMPFLTGDGDPR